MAVLVPTRTPCGFRMPGSNVAPAPEKAMRTSGSAPLLRIAPTEHVVDVEKMGTVPAASEKSVVGSLASRCSTM